MVERVTSVAPLLVGCRATAQPRCLIPTPELRSFTETCTIMVCVERIQYITPCRTHSMTRCVCNGLSSLLQRVTLIFLWQDCGRVSERSRCLATRTCSHARVVCDTYLWHLALTCPLYDLALTILENHVLYPVRSQIHGQYLLRSSPLAQWGT